MRRATEAQYHYLKPNEIAIEPFCLYLDLSVRHNLKLNLEKRLDFQNSFLIYLKLVHEPLIFEHLIINEHNTMKRFLTDKPK